MFANSSCALDFRIRIVLDIIETFIVAFSISWNIAAGVDIEAATRAGIKVARITSAYSGNAIACAEHFIHMMFGLLCHQVK